MPVGIAWQDPRYAALDASYVVEGKSRKPSQFKVRTMNWGQHWRTPGVEVVRYSIELPLSFIVDHLAKELREWVHDAILHPDPECSLECALRAASWPDPAALFRPAQGDPFRSLPLDPSLSDAVLQYFAHDIFCAWFNDGILDEEEPGYVLNTVEQAHLRAGGPSFAGEARLIGIPVFYQDAE